MLTYALAVLAAVANAVSSVLQRKANKRVPQRENMSMRQIWILLHQPLGFGVIEAITAGFQPANIKQHVSVLRPAPPSYSAGVAASSPSPVLVTYRSIAGSEEAQIVRTGPYGIHESCLLPHLRPGKATWQPGFPRRLRPASRAPSRRPS